MQTDSAFVCIGGSGTVRGGHSAERRSAKSRSDCGAILVDVASVFTLRPADPCHAAPSQALVARFQKGATVKRESARLRGLIGHLKRPNPALQVRLISIIFPRWLREHPDKVAAASKYGAKTQHPFDIDIGRRLGKSWSSIEKLRATARAIPVEILKEIEVGNIPRSGPLLETLERELRAEAKAAKSQDDWLALLAKARKIIAEHIDPKSVAPARRVIVGMAFTFISHDIRTRLEKMVENGTKVDAIMTDPPYRVAFNGQQVTATTEDGRREPIWEPAIFARLIKPNRAICLFCNKDSLAGWTMAVLEAGLSIERVVRWQKPDAQRRGAGDDAKGDDLILVCALGSIQTFGPDPALRRIKIPALTAAERAELGVDGDRIPKPSALMVPLIENFTQPGDLILDPFAGTGPVGMAAIRCGRDYLGAEADPVEAAKTIRRLQRAYEEVCDQRAA